MAIILTPVTREDGPGLIAANRDSIAYHAPWVQAFTDEAGFAEWLARQDGEACISLVAREEGSAALVGMVSLSQIFRYAFQNAYLSYFGTRATAGRGLMTLAVATAIDLAFHDLGLHRLEANIQPGNERSIALVRRLGFRQEGISPRYLHIDGAWRDHERWAILSEDWPQAEGADL